MGARQAVVLGEQGRAENSKGNLGMKEEILLGCSILEQSPGGSCSMGRRGFLAWTYAHTHTGAPRAGHSWASAPVKYFWEDCYYFFKINAGNQGRQE